MARSKTRDADLDFEKSLKKLEEIVQKLEEEEISLETSLKYYAEGQALARACERKLADAENKIKMLTENAAGEIIETAFEPECDDSDEDESEEDSPPTQVKDRNAQDEIPF